jgi:hypothetical protein
VFFGRSSQDFGLVDARAHPHTCTPSLLLGLDNHFNFVPTAIYELRSGVACLGGRAMSPLAMLASDRANTALTRERANSCR